MGEMMNTRMTLSNGIMTKGEVHWIITHDKEHDQYLLETPVTPMESDESGEVVTGRTWHLTTLMKGTLLECIEWIKSIETWETFMEDEDERPEDMEADRTTGS